MTLSILCRTRREGRRLTLEAVGDQIGVHDSHLGKFERGLAGLSVGRLERLLDALGLVVVPREHVIPQFRPEAPESASAA